MDADQPLHERVPVGIEPLLPGRALVRNFFLRVLGLIFLIAFVSLLWQQGVLFGSRGLLPACNYLQSIRASTTWYEAPTIFWLDCRDHALRLAAIAGALLSCGLIFNLAPRYCLMACWALYLSFVTIGQDFFSFQWDNLLLESAFFALFVTPAGLRPKDSPPPNPVAVFLLLWLVTRLHVESGAAKILSGDATWRNLTAMVSYYETAPLPTWVGWYAHQMPVWAHKVSALFTFVVELGLPLFIWARRPARVAVFLGMIAMQISVVLTANYGFFNYLSMALCLFVLDDGHVIWVARQLRWKLTAPRPRPAPGGATVALGILAVVIVPLSVVPFTPFFPVTGRALTPVRRVMNSWRSINAYHLFANMTLVRREVVIEGSSDGDTWLPYEFRYKPGNPARAPRFVAPYQPRVDFQLWFLLLGGPPRAPYFNNLIAHLFEAPDVVAPLFSRDPFPHTPPAFVRLLFYRYTFTDFATRRATGAWWHRELLGSSKPISRNMLAQ